MRPINNRTDAELEYAVKDCLDAVAANPDGHKAMEYLIEKNACHDELSRRARLRMYRKDVHQFLNDPLSISANGRLYLLRWRKSQANFGYTGYQIDRFRSACWMIGSFRRFGII